MTPSDSNHTNKPLPVPVTPLPSDSQHVSPLLLSSLVQGNDVPPGPPALHASPTFGALVHALRRRWRLGLAAATAATAAAVVGVFVAMPPKFTAEAKFLVMPKQDGPVFGEGFHDDIEFPLVKEYQKALVKSPLVLLAALNDKTESGRDARDLSIVKSRGSDALEAITGSLKADFKAAPQILSVWLSGDNPDEVAELLNAISKAYLKENDEKDKGQRDQRIQQLRENLREKEKELANFRRERDARRVNQEAKDQGANQQKLQQAMQDLTGLKAQLFLTRGKRDDASVDLDDLKGKLQRLNTVAAPEDKVDEYLRGDPVAQSVFKLIADVDQKVQETRRTFVGAEADRRIRAEQDARRELLAKLAERRSEIMPEIEARYRQKVREELNEKMASAERRLSSLQQQEKVLQDEVSRLEARVITLTVTPPLPVDVVQMDDRIASAQKAVDTIHLRISLMSAESLKPRVSLLQRAAAPTERDTSRQVKFAGAGGVGVFGLVLFGIALLEFRSRRISMSDDVSHGLGMHVVGSLPAVPTQVRGYLPGPGASQRETVWRNQLHESVDAIRTMLLHASRGEPLRVIMVTSANGGEGKTSLSSQLAASLSRAWRKTLLIDGDLRRPAAHALFDVPSEPGFSEVLRGEVAVGDAIRATQISRLWVLPAGNWDSAAVQALAQDNVRTLLEELKQQFDYIIVDSCPVLPVADSLLLGQHVDGVIFSILRDVSRAPEVFAARQRLEGLGIRTLGAVMVGDVNDLSSRSYQYITGKAEAVGS